MLRKHGREIAEMQYTQKRVAEMAMELYAIASCLSRTTRAIEKRGEEGARREIDLTTIFVASAERRLAENVRSFDKNDDELRKVVASRAYPTAATRSTSSEAIFRRARQGRQAAKAAKILGWVVGSRGVPRSLERGSEAAQM